MSNKINYPTRKAFADWLAVQQNNKGEKRFCKHNVESIVARVGRVYRDLCDLEKEYQSDGLKSCLIRLEPRAENLPFPEFGFVFDGPHSPVLEEKYLDGLNVLHHAVKIYVEFKKGLGGVGKKCVGKSPKSVAPTFEHILEDYCDWLIEVAELSVGASRCYKTYLKKLCSAVDAAIGEGWFESLAMDNPLSEKRFNLCSAYIEIQVEASTGSEKKNWINWRSAYRQFESFCADEGGLGKTVVQPSPEDSKAVSLVGIPHENVAKSLFEAAAEKSEGNFVVAVYSHEDLLRVFLNRLKSQSRYYPEHDLLFPARLLSKIFHGQKSNPWLAWMKTGIEGMRVICDKAGNAVRVSEIKRLLIWNDGGVTIALKNGDTFEMHTRRAGGTIAKARALHGLKGLSIDYCVSFEEVADAEIGNLDGLKKISALFKSFNAKLGKTLDARQEFMWVHDFYEEYCHVFDTDETRNLLAQDLKHLKFEYELMELKENVKKGEKDPPFDGDAACNVMASDNPKDPVVAQAAKKMETGITKQQECEFREFLEGVKWKGLPLTENGINSRVANAKKVETYLGQSLESIVATKESMLVALKKLLQHDTHGALQNAVRKYYEMRHGTVFPRIRDVE